MMALDQFNIGDLVRSKDFTLNLPLLNPELQLSSEGEGKHVEIPDCSLVIKADLKESSKDYQICHFLLQASYIS